jgi:hypothetical protein
MLSRWLCASVLLVGGCVSWRPHSLVASNKPIREAVFVAKRVEAETCQRWILGFPYGETTDGVDELMDLLHDRSAQAVALQDIRLDEITRWYLVYGEHCLHGTAEPVLRIPIVPKPGDAGGPPQGAGQPPAGNGAAQTPEELEKELLGTPSEK